MTSDGALAALDALRGRRILVAGDFLLDRYIIARPTRLSREAPVVILQHERSRMNPGGAGNAVLNVRALGGQPLPVGVVGTDPEGDRLIGLLEEAGIETGSLVRSAEATVTKTRILAGGANAAKQQVLRIDRGRAYGSVQDRELEHRARALLDGADGVLLSDYGYWTLAPRMRDMLIRRARAQGVPSCADSRYQLTEFRGIGVATPNEEEAKAALGKSFAGDNEVNTAGQELLARLGARALVLTRGSRGMRVFTESGARQDIAPARAGEVTDVTGAGDTVAATLVLALAGKVNIFDAAVLANAAASVVVRRRGAATTSPAEVRRVLLDNRLLMRPPPARHGEP